MICLGAPVTENLMDRVREVILFVAAIIAVFSFIFAVYEGANQRVPSATFLGGLAIACTFLVFMPKLEVFKVWGIEARLTKTLDRAQEILDKLASLSKISAQATYMQMAWSNRMDGPKAITKKSILDGVDAQLSELGVTEKERANIVQPFVQMIGWDFYQIYMLTFDRYSNWKSNELSRKLQLDTNEANRDAVQKFNFSSSDWRSVALGKLRYSEFTADKLKQYLDEAFPSALLDERERKDANKFRSELLDLYEGCRKKGGYTKEAAEYQDKYSDISGWSLKIKEMFGVDVNEVR